MKAQLPVFNYTVNSQSAGTLDVHIDGAIVDAETEQMYRDYLGDDTSVSYKTFRNSIEAAKPTTLNVYLNSPGGLVTDALAMHDYLQALQKKGCVVNVYWRGIVASAATHIGVAVPPANRFASKNAFGLVHNVSGGAWGDLRTMQSYVKVLEKFNGAIVNLYVAQTNLSHQKVTDMMDAETLLTADELVQYGFVGSIDGEDATVNNTAADRWGFRNRAILNVYNASKSQNSSEMDLSKITTAIETGFNNLLEKLGINKDKEGAANALTEFSTGITNAIKEQVPDEAKIQEMVNNAIGGLKDLPKNITDALGAAVNTAVAENPAIKDAVTKKDVENLVSKDDLKKVTDELDAAKAAIANRTGGAGKAGTKNEGTAATAADHAGITWGDQDDE